MTIKFLQLNIQGGVLIDEVLSFINSQNIDLVNLQEVTGGSLSSNGIDCFEYIKKRLFTLSYNGELTKTWNLIDERGGYFGNATFFKSSFKLKSKRVLWMKDYAKIRGVLLEKPEDVPRNSLSLRLEAQGKQIQVINAHLAWGKTPEDKLYKTQQAEKLYEYMKGIELPFIFSGDFNLTSNSKVVKMFQTIGRDLTSENKLENTLNLKTHYARKHIKPPGFAVDYIFAGNSIRVNSFKLIDKINLSDHYGLFAEFEF